MIDKEKSLKLINHLYDTADEIATELIEQEARKLLAADPDLDEFIMEMGECSFTIKNTEGAQDRSCNILDAIGFAGFFNMAYKFDKMFGTTDNQDNQMRFTATGEVVTEW